MRWYWEPGHYKSALGERILERIVHGRTHFGRILTEANIESASPRYARSAIVLSVSCATRIAGA